MKKLIILILLILFVSKFYGQWSTGTNKFYTNSTTKVGIRNTDPAQELDVNGNLNLTKSQLIGKQLSFGTLSNNMNINFAPGSSTNPPTLSFRLPGGAGGPFPDDGGAGPISLPNTDLSCIPTEDRLNVYVNGLITLGVNGVGGNLMVTHNGTDGYIETQGLGIGGLTHPGDLFINSGCNRNVFVFGNYGPFNGGTSKVMSIGGALNVAENLQIGGGGLATSFSQPGAQVYVDAGPNATGVKVKHSYNGTGAGIMTTESYDSDLGLAVYKAGSPDVEHFSVQGDGKTMISTTNADAFIIRNTASTPVVTCKISDYGQTFLGNNVQQNNGSMLTVGQPNKNSLALSLTDNTNSTNQDFFNVYGNGYTEIKVRYPSAMPSDRVFAIKDIAGARDLFLVKKDGKVYAREVEINLATTFPDYVFTKNYNLKSISEVATYIDANKHLPGFEKGEFYEKNGINVTEMMVKQQEKIEEQMLYIIQLEKRLLALEKRK